MKGEITSRDDDELWEGFEWEETNKILSGEIKPKTLITTSFIPNLQYPQRGPLSAKEMLSVFPNSRYNRIGTNCGLPEIVRLAKKRGYTSLIFAHTNPIGHDEIRIISLLNCAAATFRVFYLIPREDISNHANPLIRRRYPRLEMKSFNSPANAGTSRMIQSLFPKVPCSRRVAWFEKQTDLIFFRHLFYCTEEAVAGESSSVGTQTQWQECGPQFGLLLTGVEKVSFETGNFKEICVVNHCKSKLGYGRFGISYRC